MNNRNFIVFRMIPFLLPAVLVMSCSKREVPEESIRDRVVAASRGYRDPAEIRKNEGSGHFAETGFTEAFHGADWAVDDPFTDSTRFFMNCSLVSHSYPYVATRQALARSLKSEQQVFLVSGSDATLKKRLDEKMKEWDSERVQGFPETLRSRDGVDLTYRIYHIRPGRIAGSELLLEVAFVEKGGRLLLLDAGLDYGRSPTRQLLAQPRSHATLPQLVAALRLENQGRE